MAVTTPVSTSPVNNPYLALNPGAGASTTKKADDTASADRFLKLLVTQMQNQDPLNPMDNAQVTSQMAQISTVSGIQQLNGTVDGLNTQFVQMQALQGASLVGRDITLQGNRIDVRDGVGVGGFDLGSTADSSKVEILSAAGRVVGTIDMGALSAGRHAFEWPAAAEGSNYSFRVVAKAGAASLDTTPLMRDRVNAVGIVGDKLTLETEYAGRINYSDVKAVN